MRRAALGICALIAICQLCIGPAQATERVALVVGIDTYEHVAPLQKAVNDARAVGDALEEIGFTVLRAEDVGRRELNQRLVQFASQLNPGDEAVFFFAGHGITIDGRDYLLPADIPTARPGQEEFVKSEGVASDRVLDIVRARGTRVSLLILDACRDNPFPREGTRSLGGTRGLAGMAAPEGAFVMYSAGFGQLALDRLDDDDDDPNSVFTRKLLPLLREPGLPLVDAARQLRREVQQLARTVSHDQRPAYYDEITGQFFFMPGVRRAAFDPAATPGAPQEAAQPAARTGADTVAQVWAATRDTTSLAVLEAFVARFPDTIYADLAQARLEELKVAAESRDDQAAAQDLAALTPPAVAPSVESQPPATSDGAELGRKAEAAYQDQDYDEAVRLAREAARLGDSLGMFRLGWAYESGQGVEQSYREAVHWYTQGAAQGHTASERNLGVKYEHGRGVEQDLGAAVRLYRLAAEKGDATAMANLGHMYANGRGIAQDDDEAVRWYREGAEQGFARAQNNLGWMYERGRGVPKDEGEAFRRYRAAAEQGFAVAMTNLGNLYLEGRGVDRDYRQAANWYFKAADHEHGPALYNLARIHNHGWGVAQDAEAAAGYMLRSLKGGCDCATREMSSNANAWEPGFRRALQRMLQREGVYTGAIDGRFGPATRRAIETFAQR